MFATKLVTISGVALIASVLIAWVVYDFYVIAQTGTAERTISKCINDIARTYPAIPAGICFFLGAMLAHFLWPI